MGEPLKDLLRAFQARELEEQGVVRTPKQSVCPERAGASSGRLSDVGLHGTGVQ